jgi:cellulose synthase/poly-beta-1,6-N-acetylglucosamine synthase-like glycosyltransferase
MTARLGVCAIIPDWPRDRLDIKLVLEAGDRATVAAIRRRVASASYEIVIVPPIGPRTKPKALSYALAFARGEFVTVYDAEDRPHPLQLREAHAAFCRAGRDLACLQSSLVIDNGETSWLARLFTIEYAALFDGLLPALAKLGMPLPLGGTSNHFRRAALEAVGGWDPFNVTEDADLGIRLARFGYRAATIALPTLEEAPADLGPWIRQRTRWFKGWMRPVNEDLMLEASMA